MKIEAKTSVGSIVKENFRTAKVFEKNGIDFCCAGAQTMEKACTDNKIDINILIADLQETMQESDPETEYINRLSINELVEYILKRHHAYVKEETPELSYLVDKIANVHGDSHPELSTVKKEFDEAAIKLGSHLKDEEEKLFPYIKLLVESHESGKALVKDSDFSLHALLDGMMDEHTAEGDRFERLSKLTNDYAIPSDVCNTFLVTYNRLKAFQDDLHRHVHLENNLLYPKALELEKKLLN